MSDRPAENIQERIVGYVAALDKLTIDYYAENYPNSKAPAIIIDQGRKYAKITQKDNQTRVHSFIDLSNGDILKAASWRKPAPHARGNVYEADYGIKSAQAGPHGVRYL